MKTKILIIDDDTIYRRLTQRLLCGEYMVSFAENLTEAMSFLETNDAPDLVIADLHLPEMAGLELISYIQRKINNKRIPIVVISGMDDDKLKKELFKVGISDFLTKPVEGTLLQEKIAQLINS